MRLASRFVSVHLPVLAILLPLGACFGPATNASLADLPDLSVSVQTWDASDDAPTTVDVSLTYDGAAFAATHDGACATLGDDFGGRLDDGRQIWSSRGKDDVDFGGCYVPSLRYEVRFTDDRAAELTIADDSRTIRATFPVGALAPHYPTLRAPAAWKFHGGDAVRVAWSHPDDLAAPLGEFDVGFFADGKTANGDNFFPLPRQVVGDELRFTIPSPPPITGPGQITFNLGYTVGDAASCTGAARCTYSASHSFGHPVEIAR